MEIRFAQFPMAAMRAHGVLLRRRADAGVGCQPESAPVPRATPLLAVWQLAPQTRRLEVRWTLAGAVTG
jgi:hypothetical protein